QAIAELQPFPAARHPLTDDVGEEGCQQVFLLLVVPGVEPDRSIPEAPQLGANQVEQRRLAGTPIAADGERERRRGALVAEERRNPASQRGKPEPILAGVLDGAVADQAIGDARDGGTGAATAQSDEREGDGEGPGRI